VDDGRPDRTCSRYRDRPRDGDQPEGGDGSALCHAAGPDRGRPAVHDVSRIPRSRVSRLLDLGHDGDFEALDERLARRLDLGTRRAAQLVCFRLAIAQRLLGLPEGRDDDLAALSISKELRARESLELSDGREDLLVEVPDPRVDLIRLSLDCALASEHRDTSTDVGRGTAESRASGVGSTKGVKGLARRSCASVTFVEAPGRSCPIDCTRDGNRLTRVH